MSRYVFAAVLVPLAAIFSCARGDGSSARSGSAEVGGAGVCGSFVVARADVGGDRGLDVFRESHVLFDDLSDKTLVVGSDASRRPALRRCNADGSSCTARLLDANRGASSGLAVRAGIAHRDATLLTVTDDRSWSDPAIDPALNPPRISLFRCRLDGSDCQWKDLGAARAMPPPLASEQELVIDEVGGQFFVQMDCRLLHCGFDGTNCGESALSDQCGGGAFAIDEASRKLVYTTVTNNAAGPGNTAPSELLVSRCNIDGTSCVTNHLATLASPEQRLGGVATALAVDALRSKLLVVVFDSVIPGDGPLTLVRCDLDGTNCTVSALPNSTAGWSPRIQVTADELVVAAAESVHSDRPPSLLRCTPDGMSCSRADLVAGGLPAFALPSLAYDAARGAAVVGLRFAPDGYTFADFDAAFPLALFRQLRGGAVSRRDVSGGLPASLYLGQSALDEASRRLLVLANGAGVGPMLTTCNLDGTACSSAAARLSRTLLGAVDGVTYLVGPVNAEPTFGVPIELVACAPGATSCTARPLPQGETAKLDAKHRSLLVFHTPFDGDTTTVQSCPLAGDSCAAPVVYAGADVVFDDVADTVLSALPDGGLLVCHRDGSACLRRELATDGPVFWFSRQVLVGESSVLVLAVEGRPGGLENAAQSVIYRCAHDGTGCTRHEASEDLHGSAVLDNAAGKLLVAYSDQAHLYRPRVRRCELDGSACCDVDLAAGELPRIGVNPTALFDRTSGGLLVVASDATNLGRARLFALSSKPGTPGVDGGTIEDAGPPDGEAPIDAGSGVDAGGKTW